MENEEKVLNKLDQETIERLERQIKPYLYSDVVDIPEIVHVIDQYLLDNSEWRMVTVALTWADVEDISVGDILYEVVRDATHHDIDPDTIKYCVLTVIKVADASLNNNKPAILSIYYQ